eukprot:3946132-Prymnesium_polylepis.1
MAEPPKEGAEAPAEEEEPEPGADDPAYFNAIPGLRQVFTEEAMLDLWVRDQQIAWLRSDGESDAVGVEELRERVKERVQTIKDKELVNTVRGLRSELISYAIFVVLFTMVLKAFTLGATYDFSTKIKRQIITRQEGVDFSEIVTYDDAWNYMINWLSPAIFSPWSPPYSNRDQRNVLIGAVQLQQVRVSRKEKCPVPLMYVPFIQTCYPELGEESINRYGSQLQFMPTETGGVAGLFKSVAFVQDLRSDLNASEASRQME